MKIRYCIVTLNQLEWVIDQHLPSVSADLVHSVHVHVSEVEEQKYNKQKNPDVLSIPEFNEQVMRFSDWRLSASVGNFGVSNAWNLFIKQAADDGCDAVIIANDDIFLYDGVLQRFVEEMDKSKFVFFEGSNAFSFFGIWISYAQEIGKFDEAFWPAYYEDNDFHYRMKLKGYEGAVVKEPSYYHQQSATIQTFSFERRQMHHHNFRKNTAYYAAKWGGLPGHELYTTPFNGEEGIDYFTSRLSQTVINGLKPGATDD